MKKIFKFLLTFIIIFTLFNCEVKVEPKQAHAQNGKEISRYEYAHFFYWVAHDKTIIDGIEYHMYYTREGFVEVVNHTKEKLEIEKLKREIEYLKKNTPAL